MSYFTEDFIDFFSELEVNNNKSWFDDNRKRYENNVREPYKAFIEDLILEIQKTGAKMDVEMKHCVFRINRDIRFSKDKTPYKPYASAAIANGGKKATDDPGLYLAFSGRYATIGGGAYGIDKENLYFLRDYIFNHQEKFRKIIDAKPFKAMFGEIRGDRNKIIPKEFKPALEIVPEIANKHFYYMHDNDPKIVLKKDIMEYVMEHWHNATEVREFLKTGLTSS